MAFLQRQTEALVSPPLATARSLPASSSGAPTRRLRVDDDSEDEEDEEEEEE